jgi:hypothetical protein
MSLYKGIDDLLTAGGAPRRLRGAEVEAFFKATRDRLYAPLNTGTVPVAVANCVAPGYRPPFPVDVFPGPVANFVKKVAAAMGCPSDFPGLATLVVSGAAIGAARSLKVKGGWEEKPGMYAVIVSRPGTAKTPALKAIMGPIYEEQDLLDQNYAAALRQFKKDTEAYKKWQPSEDDETRPDEPTEPPPMRHIFAADTTVEALAKNLKDNPKGILVFRDELTAWVRGLDQYKARGTDRQSYLSAWSGEMVKVDRKSEQGKPIIIPHPFVSVLGGIQPDLLDELEAEGGREDGFIHRVLFSYPVEAEVKGWIEEEISEEDELEWQVTLNRLLNLQPIKPEGGSERPRQLQFSDDGREAFRVWCDQVATEMNQPDFPRELHGPCLKLRAYCARFALVIHLLRVACGEAGSGQDEGQVDAEDVARAVKLCDYFQAHARAVYVRLRQDREDQRVEGLGKWLDRTGRTSCTVRDVQRNNVCGVKTATDAQKLLAAAVDRGLGEWRGGPAKGGPEVKKTQHAKETPEFILKPQG